MRLKNAKRWGSECYGGVTSGQLFKIIEVLNDEHNGTHCGNLGLIKMQEAVHVSKWGFQNFFGNCLGTG